MPSERIQRRIDQLLDEADDAVARRDWATVHDAANAVLALDHGNQDALTYLEAAQHTQQQAGAAPPPGSATPHSFVSGRYSVRRFLGEGGKKKVYLAHDNTLDRDVAFALIKTEGLDDVARERVAREAQAMGRLGSHPHIVTVFDLGEEPLPPSLLPLRTGEGRGEVTQPYMVTELMGGGDIEGVIEKAPDGKLPLEQALRIADEVCQGLEFAHSKGIVHRDLKPGNVWLTSPQPSPAGRGGDEVGVAKIGDFGLAVAIDRTRLTQAGMMVGTVSYMPPEQATGGEVTPRSDLYSLGAMLYEMVTGRPPFIGDDNVAIIGQHLNVAPVSPTWHRPDCPPGLEALILRLLEKDPSKRPASAAEVRAALASIAGAMNRAPTRGRSGVSLSLTGEGGGEGETQAPDLTRALDNPLYRRVFVGREAELKQLQSAFDSALSGQGGLVMVVGEPGIGKTALVEQLATYATLRGGSTLWGHCYEEGSLSLPYLAFVEALRGYVQSRPPDALRAELGTAANDLARIVSEVRERLTVEPRPPSEPEEDRWRLLQAVSGFLRNASTVQPLVIVLEDLHWADQGTLDLLVHLARNLQGARLLVVGSYRDVEVDRSHPLSATLADLRRNASFGRVQLRGLGTPEVQRMLMAITGSEPPGSLAEAIHRQTEGNPLFVQEVVRYLVEEGHLGQGGAASTGTPATMTIPEGLRDVIGRRLSRLSPECNRVLAVAAVIGRDFGLETLQTVAGLEEEAVVSALEEALHVGVLEEQSRLGVIRYRFAHAFFRQTLYEELIAPRRLRLHQQVAGALERQYANRLDEHAAELAEHFAQSTDREDLAKAVRYGELAAQRALGVYAYGEAVRHLEQALAVQEVLDPDDKAKRCDLLLALGEALLPAGEPLRAAEGVCEEAFRIAEREGDGAAAAWACRLATDAVNGFGANTATGSALGRRWVARYDGCAKPGTADRVFADGRLGAVAAADGQWTDAWEYAMRGLKLARQLGDPETLVGAAADVLGRGMLSAHAAERLQVAQEFAWTEPPGVSMRSLGRVPIAPRAPTWRAGTDRRRNDSSGRSRTSLSGRSMLSFACCRWSSTSISRSTMAT